MNRFPFKWLFLGLALAVGAEAQYRESALDFALLKGFTNAQAAREIRDSLRDYWSSRERLGARERELGDSPADFRRDPRWRELNGQRQRTASRFYAWVPADFFEADGHLKFVDGKGRWKQPLARAELGKPAPSALEESLEREWLKLESEYAAAFQRGAQVHYVISPVQAGLRGIFVLLGDTSILLVRAHDRWKRYVIGSRSVPVSARGLRLDSFGGTRILVHPRKGALIWKES